MPSGRRGLGRQHQSNRARLLRSRSFNAPAAGNTQNPTSEKPTFTHRNFSTVLHPAIPDLKPLSSMAFEMLFLLYLHTTLFCQYIYLYKTVWWYPVALPPSTTSLNFHLIDRNLTLFLVVFLSRRLIWALLWDVLRPRSDNAPGIMAWILACFFIGIIWICLLVGPMIYLYYSTSLLNILVLCYPIILWLLLAKLSGESCINLLVTWVNVGDTNGTVPSGSHNDNHSGTAGSPQKGNRQDCVMTRLLDNPESISDTRTTYASMGNVLEAQRIREDVNLLCRDFNSRLSEIVFSSMVCAYYVGLLPMFFMKPHQYYDMLWCLQHTVLVLLNSFTLLSSQLFHPSYLHVLHKCANLLGAYKEEPDSISTAERDDDDVLGSDVRGDEYDVTEWSADAIFESGIKVRHKGKVYTSINKQNAAEPGDVTHSRFFFMFNKPLGILNCSLLAHGLIVIFQLGLLVRSSEWDRLISVAMFQFFSYYGLFRTLKDRIIMGKAYDLHARLYEGACK